MAKAILRATRESRVRSRHPWVFLSDIERVEGECEPGDVVEVFSGKGKFLGRAFYNPRSQIALRMLTLVDEPVNGEFFERKLRAAWAYRQQFCDANSCRVVFAESDQLPALIVDKFAGVLVLQCMSIGMERWKPQIVEMLQGIVKPEGIWERDDVPVREVEGMPQLTGLLAGRVPDRVEMVENGLTFLVDVKGGQKTGYFLDQKENRAAIAPLCKGARVLDCFCHNGSFALHAAQYGAREVVGVDISEDALHVARQNADRNGITGVRFEAHNAFDFLRAQGEAGERYDVVILDPPAFTKSRAAIEGAARGYKDINLRALKLIRPGGFLVTCSCSHHIWPQKFVEILCEASRDGKRTLRQIEMRTQGRDHPILLSSPETQYLKCALLQVL